MNGGRGLPKFTHRLRKPYSWTSPKTWLGPALLCFCLNSFCHRVVLERQTSFPARLAHTSACKTRCHSLQVRVECLWSISSSGFAAPCRNCVFPGEISQRGQTKWFMLDGSVANKIRSCYQISPLKVLPPFFHSRTDSSWVSRQGEVGVMRKFIRLLPRAISNV
jgi:hypothetical protein